MKKVFTAFLALSVGLVSCNKSDDLIGGGSDSGETKVVALSVSNQTITKAMADGIEADHEVGFEGGYIVFTDAGDRITDVFYLTNDNTDPGIATPADTLDKTDATLNTILIEDLEDNYFFRVNGDAAHVHVFGNTKTHSLVFTPTANGPIDTYLNNFAVTAKGLADAKGTVTNVPLYGVGTIQNYSDGPGSFSDQFSGEVEKIAQVVIKPIASRLELAKMTAVPYVDGSDTYTITKYDLDAIFLNYFHTGMAYNGKQISSTGFLAFNSMDDFEEDGSSTNPWYSFGNRNLFHDYSNIANYTHPSTIPNYTASPGATAVWAYNMFQAQTPAGKEPQDALPHIVLKFKNVEVSKNGTPVSDFDQEYYYITVRRYMEKGTTNYVSAFDGGYVYHIDDLEFSSENLKEVPEWREPIVAEVMFKVMKWQVQSVEVDLD